MSTIEITYCNRGYAKRWFRRLKKESPEHFETLWAIIEEIERKDGGEISKRDIFERHPEIGEKVRAQKFDIIQVRDNC